MVRRPRLKTCIDAAILPPNLDASPRLTLETPPCVVDRGTIVVRFEFIDGQDVTRLIDVKDAKRFSRRFC